MTTLDDEIREISNEDTATAEAVKSLINVAPGPKGRAEIELKSDMTEDEVKVHSILAIINTAIQATPGEFGRDCILGALIEKKERKSLSKNRLSRSEIVAVAKHPDMPSDFEYEARKQGFLRRLFTRKESAPPG